MENYSNLGFRGDRFYTAPELLFGAENRPEAFQLGDFYSLGAILFEMVTQKVLGLDVLDHQLLSRFQREAQLVPQERLEGWALDKVQQMASHQRLPPIEAVGTRLPRNLAVRIDRIYRGLANPDYLRRLKDFKRVFGELNRCNDILNRGIELERLARRRAAWGRS